MTESVTIEPSPASLRRDRLTGIALMCAALVCFAGLDATAKYLTGYMSPLQAVWARYTASVVLVTLLINPWTHPKVLRTARPWVQVARSLLLFGSTIFNFMALQYLQLAETMALAFTVPLLVVLIAGRLLGERVGLNRILAVLVGFIGVVVITRPGIDGVHPAVLLGLGSALCYALYNIATRFLAGHDSPETTMVYSGLAGVIVLTPALPLFWTDPPSLAVAGMMVFMGACGAIGHWLLILAHRRAPAAVLSPFIYTQIVWMIALGWLIFGDLPHPATLVGVAIVAASGLYLLQYERRRPMVG